MIPSNTIISDILNSYKPENIVRAYSLNGIIGQNTNENNIIEQNYKKIEIYKKDSVKYYSLKF